MKIVCLDAITLGDDIDLSVFSSFGEFVSYEVTSPDETIGRLKDADIVITNKVLITSQVIDATNLKLICVAATGTNNVDTHYAKTKGIPVKNVAGYSTPSVVQQTFASILALVNQTAYYDEYCKNSSWSKSGVFTHLGRGIDELAMMNFGIIGFGEIGQNVANVAKSFGAKVSYYSTSGANNNSSYPRLELDELLSTCDIVSIHAPLNDRTKGLIGDRELNLMKNSAVLANFGRGGIVDEVALSRAIDERGLRAAIDVLESEPPKADNPLLNLKHPERLILSPHIAWAGKQARVRLVAKIANNIQEFLQGGK